MRRLLTGGIAFMLIGVVLFGVNVKNVILTLKPGVDLYELEDWSALENGAHISTDVDFIFDYYMYEEDNGRQTKRNYMIPSFTIEGEDIYMDKYISVQVGAARFGDYDPIVADSQAWWGYETEEFPTETVTVEGYLRKLKNDEKGFLEDYLGSMGMEQSEMDHAIVPYVIVPFDSSSAKAGFIGSGVLFLVGAILTGIYILIRRRVY